ncbi:MAG: DotU family type IV/VI secretion system protein [Planctomycetes bacterium]|nr:DotU family type IV/VI secretion system protein [Planctomycetota bacterium]
MTSPTVPPQTRTLPVLAADFFTFVLELQNGEADTGRGLWQDASARLRSFLHEAQAQGQRHDLTEHCGFVLAALMDEVVRTGRWQAAEEWDEQQPLADKLFREVNAGEAFYNRLDRVLAGELDRAGADAVEVFATALCLGFRGGRGGDNEDAIRRLFRGVTGPDDEDAIRDLVTKLRDRIVAARGDDDRLSPHPVAPPTVRSQMKRIPHWWYAAGAVALTALIAIILELLQASYWTQAAEALPK